MLEVINLLQTTYLDPGTVSVRVAFVLRSTEVIPAFSDLFPPPNSRPPDFRKEAHFDPLRFAFLSNLFLILSINLFLTLFIHLVLRLFINLSPI